MRPEGEEPHSRSAMLVVYLLLLLFLGHASTSSPPTLNGFKSFAPDGDEKPAENDSGDFPMDVDLFAPKIAAGAGSFAPDGDERPADNDFGDFPMDVDIFAPRKTKGARSFAPDGDERPADNDSGDFPMDVDIFAPRKTKGARSFAPDGDERPADNYSGDGPSGFDIFGPRKAEGARSFATDEDENDETEFLKTLNDLYPINGNHPRRSNQVQHWEDDAELPLIHEQLPSEQFNKTGQLRYSSVPVVEGELIQDLLDVIFSREDYILLLNNPNRANMEKAVKDMIRGPTQEVLKQQLLHKALAARASYLKYIEPMLKNNKRQQLLDFANHLIDAKKQGILSTNDTILMNEVLTNIAFFDRGDDVQFRGTIDELLNKFGAIDLYGKNRIPTTDDGEDLVNATDYDEINNFANENEYTTLTSLLTTSDSISTDQLLETTRTPRIVIGESNRDVNSTGVYTGYPSTASPPTTASHDNPKNHTASSTWSFNARTSPREETTIEPATLGASSTNHPATPRTRGPYDPVYYPPRPRPTNAPVPMTSTYRPMPPVQGNATNGVWTGSTGQPRASLTSKPTSERTTPNVRTRPTTGYKPTGTTTGKSTRGYMTTGRTANHSETRFSGYKTTGTSVQTDSWTRRSTGNRAIVNEHSTLMRGNGTIHAAPSTTEEPLELVKIKNVTSPLADDDVKKIQSILQ